MAAKLKKRLSPIVFILIYLLIAGSIHAQNGSYVFRNFTPEDGLSQSSITCIFQGGDQFLWFGTYGGLNRYDGYNFKIYEFNDTTTSIVHNHIRSIAQDTSKLIIIGTVNGISCLNPETNMFENYVHDPSDPTSLSNNMVYKVFRDRENNIWIGMWGGGLDRIERSHAKNNQGKHFRFVHYKPAENSDINIEKITDIAETSDGNLWLATRNGLVTYNKRTGEYISYRYKKNDPSSLSGDNVSAVCTDKQGNVWVGTWETGLNLYRKNGTFIRFMSSQKKNSIGNNVIKTIYCDHAGSVWVGTWGGGLCKITLPDQNLDDLTDEEVRQQLTLLRLEHSEIDKNSISGNSIYSIFEDNTGILWIGTDYNGLNKLNRQTGNFGYMFSEPGNSNSLSNNVVFSVSKDNKDLLWIGTQNGLNRYSASTGKFTIYRHNSLNQFSVSDDHIKTLFVDSKGNIWIGTTRGFDEYDYNNNRFLRHVINSTPGGSVNVMSIAEDTNHILWIGTYGTGLLRFNPEDLSIKIYAYSPDDPYSISDNVILKVITKHDGKLLLGTGKEGLCEFNPVTEKFIRFHNIPGDNKSLSDNTVYSLMQDHKGVIWVGTSVGLNKMARLKNGKTEFIHYDKNRGLPANDIVAISEDSNGNLWLSSSKGLIRFHPENVDFSIYSTGDGLQGKEFSANALFYDKAADMLYAGGQNGLNFFNPSKITDDTVPPVTRIVNLRIFNRVVNVNDKVNGRIILEKSIVYTQKLILTYDESVISLEYAALQFQSPKDNHYAFMLKGFDKGWNNVGSQRTATYTNLPPGKYTFMVKASNYNGIWSKNPTLLEIIVKPAWWQTWLFRILVLLFIFFVLGYAYILRINLLKKNQHFLEETVNRRTEELSEANELLQEKQQEIIVQNNELVRHRNDLEALVKERTAELTLAKEKAEESDRLKSAFLANMSHEIRTPMNAIVGFSNLLEDETLNRNEKEMYVQTIKNNSETLLTIINDILDISLIEANQLVLYKELFCVDELLGELKAWYLLKNEKNLRIELIDNLVDKTFIYNDKIRLRQILVNLLNNAYKFTDSGTISFGYVCEEKNIRFIVRDTGIGIEDKEKSSVFDYFHKIEHQKRKFSQGTGIGLSICQKLVNIMGGEINVISESGKGSEFSFTLPDAISESRISKKSADENKPFQIEGYTIIVAEDVTDNYRYIDKLLSKTGASLIWAQNGQAAVDALEKVQDRKKCIVLMDIKMPVMNGIEACQLIKEKYSFIPVIAVTAYAQSGDKERIMAYNFNGYVTKPLTLEKLWKAIMACLSEIS